MLPVRNVFVVVRVNVFFGKAKIDNVDDSVLFCQGVAYQEILGFDVIKINLSKTKLNILKGTNAMTNSNRGHLGETKTVTENWVIEAPSVGTIMAYLKTTA